MHGMVNQQMNTEWQFMTPYLRSLDERTLDELRKRRESWGLTVNDFYERIEAWFGNFLHCDQPLALKLLLNLQYYSEPDFRRGVENLQVQIKQYLFTTGGSLQDLRLVVPSSRGDSADRHAYDIIKAWGLNQAQVITVEELSQLESQCVLVFFNDTHGTGNQFLREVFSKVKKENFKAIFVVAISIAAKALLRFNRELKGIRVLPDLPTPSVFDKFTASEVRRLGELGTQVYPKHPFGYGDSGLLVSYYFQCPNNTLPLIWADSENNNNSVGGKAYPWKPLFPYRPKGKTTERPAIVQPPVETDPSLLDCKLEWTPEERQQIVNRIEEWGLTSPKFYKTAKNWFCNFKYKERKIALKIFLATSYLNISSVRSIILDFREKLMSDLGRVGGDMGDIILVTTGDEKSSVYHYVYEFIKVWNLSVDQVCSLDRLSPDRVIDKTLVFFYHTRADGKHFEENHIDRLTKLAPRAVVFAAYAMSPKAKGRFYKFGLKSPSSVLYCEKTSRTISTLSKKHLKLISKIESKLQPKVPSSDPRKTFLNAYYFQCPASSSPLLWLEKKAKKKNRSWVPLFRKITMPSNDVG